MNSKTQNHTSGRVRYLHETLFSVALAVAFSAGLIYSCLYWYEHYLGWSRGFNIAFHQREQDLLGYEVVFAVLAFTLAIAVFLLLRIFSRIALIASLLRIAGVVILAAPAASLWVIWCALGTDYFINAGLLPWLPDGVLLPWLPCEEFVAIVLVLLYLYRRWPLPAWASVLLVAGHFAIWYRAYHITYAWLYPHLLSIPIAACCSTLMWGCYLNKIRPEPRPAAV